jgi:predicted TIM-barrel fold metal-dependent hydrolase
MLIVDAHHHLWKLDAVDYPWLNSEGVRRFFGDPAPIQHDYEARDFRVDHHEFEVGKSVHIQVGAAAGAEVDETRWLDRHAAQHDLPTAIVAYCDLSADDARACFHEHLASSSRVRGFRQIFSRHPSEDFADRSPELINNVKVAANLRVLSSLGLSFDLQLTPPHLLAAARLFGSLENLKVALCHGGSPWARDPAGLAEWRAGLSVLAALPNMHCKLSGLGMFDPAWTQASLTPIVETIIETFGPERVMWGSNFPVDKLYRSYAELLSTMLAIVPGEMHEQVFRTTAETFYRI